MHVPLARDLRVKTSSCPCLLQPTFPGPETPAAEEREQKIKYNNAPNYTRYNNDRLLALLQERRLWIWVDKL